MDILCSTLNSSKGGSYCNVTKILKNLRYDDL